MIRTPLGQEHIKRTCRPNYGIEIRGPRDVLLDPSWNKAVDIYPGMALMVKASASSGAAEYVTLVDATGLPAGLAADYCAPGIGIDPITESGINAFSMWVLSPGDEFEILAPAFDSAASWTFPTDGTALLVHAYTGASGSARGKLAPAGASNITTKPVAQAIARPATDRLIIRALSTSQVA